MTKAKKNNTLIIFVAVFLAAALIFGAVLGIIIAVGNAGAIFKYEGISLKSGTVNYLSSYYKYNYLKMLTDTVKDASDSEEFWQREAYSGKTYGALLAESAEQYLKEVLISVYLYDSYATLSKDEKNNIKRAVGEVLDYKANGDETLFNSICSEFGFDYSDFALATEILYKSYKAKTVLYGNTGANLKNYPELCNEYLESEFSHVRLLFIRTADRFVVDENGNRVKDDEGNDLTVSLTDEEIAQRQNAISELDRAVSNKENGLDGGISPEMFSLYQKNFGEGDSEKDAGGYYFAEGAEYTVEFRSAYPAVVDTALDMSVGSYKKAVTDEGVCYIYRIPTEKGAYLDSASGFFSDFYMNCADFGYSESLSVLSAGVSVSESFDKTAVVTMPYNSDFIAYISGD